MAATDGELRVVAMTEHTVTTRLRTRGTTVALLALLMGGTAGMFGVASHLSNEIVHAQGPSAVPAAPGTERPGGA